MALPQHSSIMACSLLPQCQKFFRKVKKYRQLTNEILHELTFQTCAFYQSAFTLCYASVVLNCRKWTPNPPCQTEIESSSFLGAHQTNEYTLYKRLIYSCPQEKTSIPELILERSHFLMQSWCTYCRLPVHLQGSIRGLELDCSPIWQIRHRSPSSSSESSNSRLKVGRRCSYNQQIKLRTCVPTTLRVPNHSEFRPISTWPQLKQLIS